MFRIFADRRLFRFIVVPLVLIALLALALPVAADQPDPNSATPPAQAAPAAANTGAAMAPTLSTPGRAALAGVLAPTVVTGITDPALITPSSVYNFSGDAEFSTPTAFPDGTFSGTGEVRVTGSSWSTWNPDVAGIHILYASGGSYEIIFNDLQTAVGAVAEPNNFDVYNITIEAFDAGGVSLGSFTRAIMGESGAAFLGLLSDTTNIKRVVLSSEAAAGGFAFSDLTYGGTPTAAATVLLLKDVNPWNSTANEQILTANGISYDVKGSADLAALDLSVYQVVIVASDQTQAFYDTLAANEAALAAYVAAGGTLQFGAGAWGWNGGDASAVTLPGGAAISQRYEYDNYITLPDHPVVAGVPNPFSGSYASHAAFSGVPGPSNLIAFTGAAAGAPGWAPTLVEYEYGNGCVLALGQTLEYGYDNGQVAGTILQNAIVHSVNSACSDVGMGRLFGWLYIDENQNGWRDVGEDMGLPAINVLLLAPDESIVNDTSTTIPRGWYEFNNILAGNYCIQMFVPDAYVTTTPAKVCFAFDGTQLNVNVGVIKAEAFIGDTVYADANSNGMQDAGEMGYAGVTLALWTAVDDAPGAVIAETTTDADGHYGFTVVPGTYFVQVTDTNKVLSGLTLTGGVNPAGPITVALGATYDMADFGYNFVCPSTRSVLSGKVWEDMNGDNTLGSEDMGIAGVQVCANPMSQIYAPRCVFTGADGTYRMCVRPLTYLVAPVVADSPVAGLMPINRAFRLPLAVKPGMQFTDVNFGFTSNMPAQ